MSTTLTLSVNVSTCEPCWPVDSSVTVKLKLAAPVWPLLGVKRAMYPIYQNNLAVCGLGRGEDQVLVCRFAVAHTLAEIDVDP